MGVWVQVKLTDRLSTAMQIAHDFQTPYSASSRDDWGVGIGWDVETWSALRANSTLIWRAGNTYGCSAFIAMNAHLQKGFVLLANQGAGENWSPENIGAMSPRSDVCKVQSSMCLRFEACLRTRLSAHTAALMKRTCRMLIVFRSHAGYAVVDNWYAAAEYGTSSSTRPISALALVLGMSVTGLLLSL